MVVAVVVLAARRVGFGVAARTAARPVAGIVVAGLLVGVIAVVFRSVADRPVDLVLFSGQSEMPALLLEGSTGVLLLLVVAKGLAYALSLGSGFRGGPVFPAIAMGTALGLAAADLISGLEPAPAVVAGIAASTAVVLRAPFTAALLAAVLVGAAASDTAPIAVLAAAIGFLVSIALPEPKPEPASRHGEAS